MLFVVHVSLNLSIKKSENIECLICSFILWRCADSSKFLVCCIVHPLDLDLLQKVRTRKEEEN